MDLVDGVLSGDARAAARLITHIENESCEAELALARLFPHTGKAQVIGITGSPGVGKSTLVDQMAKHYRKQELKVGIIAVDPSSPFSGGAILGDRIRMSELYTDNGVFIRSMGSRGCSGGLNNAVKDVTKVLDAFGMDKIIIETVGAGQAEVEIAKIADTTVVVLVPGLGDDIQAIKAGILEIGDVFAVNKADREGADRTVLDIESMIEMGYASRSGAQLDGWEPKVIKVIARDGTGVDEFVSILDQHLRYLKQSGKLEEHRNQRLEMEITDLVQRKLAKYVFYELENKEKFDELLETVFRKQTEPHQAAEKVLKELLNIKKPEPIR